MLILSGSNACRRFTDKTRHDRLPEKAILLASNHRGDMRAWICKPAPKVDSAYIVNRCETARTRSRLYERFGAVKPDHVFATFHTVKMFCLT